MKKEENTNNKQKLTDELISTFYEIDGKISKLHAHSSEVFLQLNSYLKDYHSKSRIVSDNATNIFTTIVGNEKENMLKELQQLLDQLNTFRKSTEKNNADINRKIDDLLEKINIVVVKMRNFKQDLLTLDYLIANYRFVRNYNDHESGKKDKAN